MRNTKLRENSLAFSVLQNMSDQIPQGQQYQRKGNVGQQGSGSDADDGIAEQVHQVGNGADNDAGENCFAQLLADDISEEEGVQSADDGVDGGKSDAYQKFQCAQKQHGYQQAQKYNGSVLNEGFR